jgi:hypothetical protein
LPCPPASVKTGYNIKISKGFKCNNRVGKICRYGGFPARIQVILKAMKKYGLILADVGSNMYISGAPGERWDNDELRQLGNVKASNFEVVKFN